MPNLISKWLKKRRSKIPEGEAKKPPIPALPTPRRPLTPTFVTGSSDSGDTSGPDSSRRPKRQGPFFERLPFEIRRQILVEAFGGQTIHMNLTFDRPLDLVKKEAHPEHCNRNVDYVSKEGRLPLLLDYSKTERWYWFSSVCHNWSRGGVAADRCNHGGSYNCHQRPFGPLGANFPGCCFIGVMGWLLTCRQAYVEGVDVLYSTNTVHIQDLVILRHAPELFVPHHWAKVRSVEIRWLLNPFREARPTDPPESDLASFHDLVARLPALLPGVGRLNISLQGTSVFGRLLVPDRADGPEYKTIQRDLIEPLGAMLKELDPRGGDCIVSAPSTLYVILLEAARAEGPVVQQVFHGQIERHWQSLTGESRRTGYWVYLGEKDMFTKFQRGRAVTLDEDSVLSRSI